MLHDVSLVISPGDRITVVGLNGVGKSTLLRVHAGLVLPDAGLVSAAGGQRVAELVADGQLVHASCAAAVQGFAVAGWSVIGWRCAAASIR